MMKKILYYLRMFLPYGMVRAFDKYELLYSLRYIKHSKKYINRNLEIINYKKNASCFILLNGVSAGDCDLAKLIHKDVFSVTSGYKHKNFNHLSPVLHFIPQLTYDQKQYTETYYVSWFLEMDQSIPRGTGICMNLTERALVLKYNLFPQRNVYYFDMCRPWDRISSKADIAVNKILPYVQTVSIMCLFAAINMGYENIFLIGADHNSFLGTYKYPFNASENINTDQGRVIVPLKTTLKRISIQFEQYAALKEIAHQQGIYIANLSASSALDEFHKMNYEDAIAKY